MLDVDLASQDYPSSKKYAELGGVWSAVYSCLSVDPKNCYGVGAQLRSISNLAMDEKVYADPKALIPVLEYLVSKDWALVCEDTGDIRLYVLNPENSLELMPQLPNYLIA